MLTAAYRAHIRGDRLSGTATLISCCHSLASCMQPWGAVVHVHNQVYS